MEAQTKIKTEQKKAKLEDIVQRECSTTQKIFQAFRGYGVPLLGGVGGYLVGNGLGGAGRGMILTSLAMAALDAEFNLANLTAFRGYCINFALGGSTAIINELYK